MTRALLGTFFLVVAITTASSQVPPNDPLIARAKSLELDTPYVPPPGDPLAHHAAGYAKVMCSAVFMTGLAPDFAAENVGFFTAPYGMRQLYVSDPDGYTLCFQWPASEQMLNEWKKRYGSDAASAG